jgi:hypothetical protein
VSEEAVEDAISVAVKEAQGRAKREGVKHLAPSAPRIIAGPLVRADGLLGRDRRFRRGYGTPIIRPFGLALWPRRSSSVLMLHLLLASTCGTRACEKQVSEGVG